VIKYNLFTFAGKMAHFGLLTHTKKHLDYDSLKIETFVGNADP